MGFEAASYNRIIAATGISKGAMYYYFADKTDLYLAVIEDVLDRIEVAATAVGPIAATDAEGFWAELLERALGLHEVIAEGDANLAAFGDRLYQSGVGVEHMMARLTTWITSLLKLGQERNAVRSDLPLDLLAHAATGLMTSLDRYFLQVGADIKPEAGAQAIGLCRDLLFPRS